MSRIPRIRVKSKDHAHDAGFFIRNHDDLRYGEVLFMADEFESLGEDAVRLKIASLPSDDPLIVEADLWLELKAKEQSESEVAARSAREAETLSIAREANSIARLASKYAFAAMIIAAILAAIEIYEFI